MTVPIETGQWVTPLCPYCNRSPSEIDEYVDMSEQHGTSPDEYVARHEGTFNRKNGHFACTDCYIDQGMPSSPEGWVAP